MTKKKLIEALEKYPDNMEVFLNERQTEFTFGLLNEVWTQDISFIEDADDDTEDAPKVKCIVLSES